MYIDYCNLGVVEINKKDRVFCCLRLGKTLGRGSIWLEILGIGRIWRKWRICLVERVIDGEDEVLLVLSIKWSYRGRGIGSWVLDNLCFWVIG